MTKDEIATKQDITDLETRFKELLVQQFDLIIQEIRLQQLKDAVAEERLTKKEVMKLLRLSPNKIDKLEQDGKLIVEDWGDGKKRVLRYPQNQFLRIVNTDTQAA